MMQCAPSPQLLSPGEPLRGGGGSPRSGSPPGIERDDLDALLFASGEPDAAGTGTHTQQRSATPWGVKSSQGERQSMEDAWSVQAAVSAAAHGLLAGGCGGLASAVATGAGAGLGQHEAPSSEQADATGGPQPFPCEDLTMFAVFDGHGGLAVAQHCSDNLHKHFAAHLVALGACPTCSSPTSASGSPSEAEELRGEGGAQAAEASAAGPSPSLPEADPAVKKAAVGEALRQAFLRTDRDLAGTDEGDFVGCTAVVAVLGKSNIWIAHCGDSRAVIQKNGEAVPVTKDHKPDREDEAARVRAAGGRIVFNSGSYRIMGMLAMSRAIGDHFLRPYVIAEPEVAVLERTAEDEVLVIATDGLWDVFSCKEATTLAQRCIVRSKDRGMSRYGGCRVAASVLTKVAMERGSRDNITVIVVDITQAAEGRSTPEPLDLIVPSSAHNEDGTARDDVNDNAASSYSLGTCVFIKSKSTKSLNYTASGGGSGSAASSGGAPGASQHVEVGDDDDEEAEDGDEGGTSGQRQQQQQPRQQDEGEDEGEGAKRRDLERGVSESDLLPRKYIRTSQGRSVTWWGNSGGTAARSRAPGHNCGMASA